MLKLFAMILMLGIALPTWAKDATACIKLGVKEKSQTLTNICDKRVHVIWCHSPTPKDRDAECGRNNRFFKQNTVLKPGEMTENMFSLPLDTTITYGACEGGWFTTEPAGKNTNHEYYCNAGKTAEGELVPFTVTVAKRDREVACKSAQLIALEEAKAMTHEEATALMETMRAASVKRAEEARLEHEIQAQRYQSMKAQVEAWTPPTPDHANLKAFMLEQIAVSVRTSTGGYLEQWEFQTPEQFLAMNVQDAERELARANERLAEHMTAVAKANKWLSDLTLSVGPPA